MADPDAAPIEGTKREALLLRAALHKYLRHIEQHAAEDDYRTHTREQLADTRRELGGLIWRLENAATWPRQVDQHGRDAVPPSPDDHRS